MKRLVIIPARGGSKRFPNKNIKLLDGRPLIQHTIDTVSPFFDKVIVSSDSEEILNIITINEKVQPYKRPKNLATDTSKVIDTVRFHFNENEHLNFDQIWLSLPTCPLKSENDVICCQNLLTKEIDGIISITEYEFPPDLGLLRNNNDLISGYLQSFPLSSGNSRSQDQRIAYRPNGALYGMWTSSFKNRENFYQGNVKGYIMPRDRSIDIDSCFDLFLAEQQIKFRLKFDL